MTADPANSGEPGADVTHRERDVLVALCRPALEGGVFTEPASVRQIAEALVVTDAAVKQHLSHLYDKFDIPDTGTRRRVLLAKEAIRRGAVTLRQIEAASEGLQAGREAFERRDWARALELLTAADATTQLDADDLELLVRGRSDVREIAA
jgi:predicted ArsR family transcriptional regulator